MSINKKIFAIILLISGLYSCTQSKKESSTNKLPLEKSTETIKGCYTYTVKKDTFQLAVTSINNDNIVVSLMYNFFEKDDAKGTFNGTFDGSILKGDYTFQSEGRTSVREVVFKKTQTGFVEGNGEVKDLAGKTIFSKPDSIAYENGIEFTKTENCLP